MGGRGPTGGRDAKDVLLAFWRLGLTSSGCLVFAGKLPAVAQFPSRTRQRSWATGDPEKPNWAQNFVADEMRQIKGRSFETELDVRLAGRKMPPPALSARKRPLRRAHTVLSGIVLSYQPTHRAFFAKGWMPVPPLAGGAGYNTRYKIVSTCGCSGLPPQLA